MLPMSGQAIDIVAADSAPDRCDAPVAKGARDDVSTHILDRAIRWTVCGMLAFAPAAFGGVDGWSESVLVLLAALVAVGLAIRARRHGRADWTWAYLPLALFALLVGLQLAPLPPGLVKL